MCWRRKKIASVRRKHWKGRNGSFSDSFADRQRKRKNFAGVKRKKSPLPWCLVRAIVSRALTKNQMKKERTKKTHPQCDLLPNVWARQNPFMSFVPESDKNVILGNSHRNVYSDTEMQMITAISEILKVILWPRLSRSALSRSTISLLLLNKKR